MTLQDLREKRNRLQQQAGDFLQTTAGELTSEQRTKIDAMFADIESLDTDIARHERVATFDAEQRAATRPHREQPSSNPADNARAAFRTWMQNGKVEQRDMGVGPVAGVITGGSVLVPTLFDPLLHSTLKSFGEIATAVRTLRTGSGAPMKVALDDDTANGLTLLNEATAATELDPSVSGTTSNVDTLTTGLIKVSNQLLNDSEFSIDAFISEKLGVRYARGLAQLIAQGNNSNVQALTPGATITAPSGETNTFTINDLQTLYGTLDPAYVENASWVMTNSTKIALMQIKDGIGHSLLQPDASGRPFNSILGRPIVISQYSSQLGANNVPVLFGDLAASYTLRLVGGLEIVRSVDRYFELNETAFVGFCRIGGYGLQQAASPSLVGLKNSAS